MPYHFWLLQGEHVKHTGTDLDSGNVGLWLRDQEAANSIKGQRIKLFSFAGYIQSLSLLLKSAIIV